ncbi:unnamed protein product [Gongylonema pulchrum]|uniref:Uncharacterized protein n=1 Tax=Gongylonema pulchrum TaxID=637853 RepID=A0A183CWM0_9BILA|nr:unnamed protein product [Gongylonema pulchrum]
MHPKQKSGKNGTRVLVDGVQLLRVVKAFRSSLDEFEEKRSIASTQSCNSMRGVAAGWSYLSLSGINASRAASCVAPLPSHTRVALVTFMQRANAPQPYPYYHSQQPRTRSPPILNCTAASDSTGNTFPLPAAGDGRELDTGFVILNEQIATPAVVARPLERMPLVQRWRPSGASGYSSQRIAKSISLDTPVSIAHV